MLTCRQRFCWVVIMGAAWETTAFSLRTVGAHNQQEKQYAIWGQILFLLSPLCKSCRAPFLTAVLMMLGINAFAYMTVARMVYFGLPDRKIWGVRAVKLTVLFVWLDVVCFLVQVAGGMMLSNDGDEKLTGIGMKIYTTGIGIQLGFVVIFGAMTGWFYYRMQQRAWRGMGRLRLLTWTMLAVLALIVVSFTGSKPSRRCKSIGVSEYRCNVNTSMLA